jgi:SAM-dependent methyltransferase
MGNYLLGEKNVLLNIPVEQVESMSYPDFVGYLHQHNTPPGGINTLLSWIQWAKIELDSNVFDIACSTGFSSRNISNITGCKGLGIDLSNYSIHVARKEATQVSLQDKLKYCVGDVTSVAIDDSTFTHALGGCNFSFIQEREKALQEVHRILKQNGTLCVANFFYDKEPSISIIDEVESAICFRPNPLWTYDFWKEFFSNLFVLDKSVINDLPVLSEKSVYQSVEKTIATIEHLNVSLDIKEACFSRLLRIRRTLNKHREYQKYTVDIWRKS